MPANDIDERAGLLLDDPLALVGHSLSRWTAIRRDDLDVLQLRGLQMRFAQLRDAIPVLRKLADAEGIDGIDTFDDVVPLLFEHTVFKSYPPSLLEKANFAAINRWLGKLVTPELAEQLAAADVLACKGLDDWFMAMDAAVPGLRLSHTSGTSGTLSFLPHGVNEWRKMLNTRRMVVFGLESADQPIPELHMVYPYYRKGFLSHLRGNDFLIEALLPDIDHFHCAYPATLSSDVLHLGARLRAAQAKGTLDRLEISAELRAKKAEFDALQAAMPEHLANFFAQIVNDLKGQRIYTGGTWNLLHGMAVSGLAKGMEGVFSPDSYVATTGGAKGQVRPENWEKDVQRFIGVKRLNESYAMSEVLGSHLRCEHGHFHFQHTVVPFQLDPETSKPLPREGRVTGRAAFFDLGAETRWGGFITGDEITIEWDRPCPCGQDSRYVVGGIERYSEKQGGDDKITCAASENSHREAMDFLGGLEE